MQQPEMEANTQEIFIIGRSNKIQITRSRLLHENERCRRDWHE